MLFWLYLIYKILTFPILVIFNVCRRGGYLK